METAAAAHMSAAVGKKHLPPLTAADEELLLDGLSFLQRVAQRAPAAAERSQRRANGFFIFRLSLVAFCDWHTGNASHPCVMIICTLHLGNAIVFLSLSLGVTATPHFKLRNLSMCAIFETALGLRALPGWNLRWPIRV
jgi:hypothetical protein